MLYCSILRSWYWCIVGDEEDVNKVEDGEGDDIDDDEGVVGFEGGVGCWGEEGGVD